MPRAKRKQFTRNGREIVIDVLLGYHSQFPQIDMYTARSIPIHFVSGEIDGIVVYRNPEVTSIDLVQEITLAENECKRYALRGPKDFSDLEEQLTQLGFK